VSVPDCRSQTTLEYKLQIPVWTLATVGDAPAAGPASHPTPYIPPTPGAPPPTRGRASNNLSRAAQAGIALGSIGGVLLLVGLVAALRPVVVSRLVAARRQGRLTSALMNVDGACEITVVPSRNAESHFQLADIKSKPLDKEGIV
jgi:hypothetical protein